VIATNFFSFSVFIFYQYTAPSSRAVDGLQMYSLGSVVGKASTIDPEILLAHPLIFTGGGQKVRNLASISTSLNFALKMQQHI